MRIGVMNQHWNLLGSNLLGTITKDKKHRINHITFATTIRTHNGRKTLMERSQSLFSIVRLEILVLDVSDHEPRPVTFKGQGRWRWGWNVNAIDVNSTVFVTDFFRWIWRSLKNPKNLKKKETWQWNSWLPLLELRQLLRSPCFLVESVRLPFLRPSYFERLLSVDSFQNFSEIEKQNFCAGNRSVSAKQSKIRWPWIL